MLISVSKQRLEEFSDVRLKSIYCNYYIPETDKYRIYGERNIGRTKEEDRGIKRDG